MWKSPKPAVCDKAEYTLSTIGENRGVLRNCFWKESKIFFFSPWNSPGDCDPARKGRSFPPIVIMIDFPKNIKKQRQDQKEKTRQHEKSSYGLWLLRLDAGCVTLFNQNTMQRSEGVHSCFDSPYISRAVFALMGNAKRMVCIGRKCPLTYRRKIGGISELFFVTFVDLINL